MHLALFRNNRFSGCCLVVMEASDRASCVFKAHFYSTNWGLLLLIEGLNCCFMYIMLGKCIPWIETDFYLWHYDYTCCCSSCTDQPTLHDAWHFPIFTEWILRVLSGKLSLDNKRKEEAPSRKKKRKKWSWLDDEHPLCRIPDGSFSCVVLLWCYYIGVIIYVYIYIY